MNVKDFGFLAVCAAYFAFLVWMKKETQKFNKALLNRFSDFAANAFPDVAVPGVEDYDDVEDEVPLHIEGLDDE